jgi:hypothetical protein
MTTRLALMLIIGFTAMVQASDKSIEVTLEDTPEHHEASQDTNVRRWKFESQRDSKTCLEATAREIAQPCFTTLTGFKAAFRKAHDAHDMQQMVRLVCRDRATDTMRSNMCEKLRASFRCDIKSMHFERPNAEDMQYHWNIKPTRVLVVKYYGFPPKSGYLLTQWYPLGKKGAGFCFAISNEPWQKRPTLW